MKKQIIFPCAVLLFLAISLFAQVPMSTAVQILKAEDARRYDRVLADLMASSNAAVRTRAALAAGRIGDDKAILPLAYILGSDPNGDIRAMAAFALGEIESIKAADAILKALRAETRPLGSVSTGQRGDTLVYTRVYARLVEAAGKIAAANAKDAKAKELGTAILETLEAEKAKAADQNREIVLLGLTAALRGRPDKADVTVAKFLTDADARIRADAANTLTRLRARNANETLRKMLVSDTDAIARANAARALGAAEDKKALDILIKAATEDKDSRVRVSAIRALGSLKDERAVEPLGNYEAALFKRVIVRDGKILATSKYYAPPPEQNEWLEITTALGNILAGKKDQPASRHSSDGTVFDSMPERLQQLALNSPEVSMARPKISPENFMIGFVDRFQSAPSPIFKDWHSYSSVAQGLGVVAALPKDKYGPDLGKYQNEAQQILRLFMADKALSPLAMPDVLTAYAALKPDDLADVLRKSLNHPDVIVRATSAGLIADQPMSRDNVDALQKAFTEAFIADQHDNDAQLAILDALYKIDKKESVGALLIALSAPDYLVRKKAFELLADKDLQKDFPGIPTSLEYARAEHKDQVFPYSPALGTKLGQVLNTDADYRRALNRKNGTVKAVLTTEKGTFTIDFMPEEAPLTVDNFVKLARSGYFNGLEVHRVVPNFVMQDGDPRGDGNGGPGWSIRCEVNMISYERGVVGMALSGKDTGGSQWFVTHSPQPHLDGGYTVFGHVNETGMKVVDNIVRGDKIISVKIIEGKFATKGTKSSK